MGQFTDIFTHLKTLSVLIRSENDQLTYSLTREWKAENVSLAICWIRFIERSLQHVTQWTACIKLHQTCS